jgi:HTH-type transcriptional regulator/antitoxin HigA
MARKKDEEALENEITFAQKNLSNVFDNLKTTVFHIKKGERCDWKMKTKLLLNFYQVASFSYLHDTTRANHTIAYRQTSSNDICEYTVSAWLRCGDLEAEKIKVKKYNPILLKKSISELRKLTLDSKNIGTNIQQICGECAVKVVFTPFFKKTYIAGAARWRSEHPIIQISDRGKRNDKFWFTFFHELAHIIHHSKKTSFANIEEEESPRFIESTSFNKDSFEQKYEKEADDYARNILIPNNLYEPFFRKYDFSDYAIKKFAEVIGIHPGIVAGRIENDLGKYGRYDHLKVKLHVTLQP